MKEILIVVVVAIVVTASIFIQKYLNSTSKELLNKLEKLKKEMEEADFENAYILSEETIKKWEEINEYWSLMVLHQEIDQIELSIIGVDAAIKGNNLRRWTN